jgi:hypothetical protein
MVPATLSCGTGFEGTGTAAFFDKMSSSLARLFFTISGLRFVGEIETVIDLSLRPKTLKLLPGLHEDRGVARLSFGANRRNFKK